MSVKKAADVGDKDVAVNESIRRYVWRLVLLFKRSMSDILSMYFVKYITRILKS